MLYYYIILYYLFIYYYYYYYFLFLFLFFFFFFFFFFFYSVTPLPPKLYERVKVLEDKIIKIEHDYPTWASVHFNQPNKNVRAIKKNIYIYIYYLLFL